MRRDDKRQLGYGGRDGQMYGEQRKWGGEWEDGEEIDKWNVGNQK